MEFWGRIQGDTVRFADSLVRSVAPSGNCKINKILILVGMADNPAGVEDEVQKQDR